MCKVPLHTPRTRVRTILTIGYRFGRLLHYQMTIGPDSFSPFVVPIVRLAVTEICTDILK